MRIEAYNQVTQIYNSGKVSKIKGSGSVDKRDQLQISQTGRDYHVAKQAVADAPDIREDKVMQVKKRIASGNYKVEAGDFAAPLLTQSVHTALARVLRRRYAREGGRGMQTAVRRYFVRRRRGGRVQPRNRRERALPPLPCLRQKARGADYRRRVGKVRACGEQGKRRACVRRGDTHAAGICSGGAPAPFGSYPRGPLPAPFKNAGGHGQGVQSYGGGAPRTEQEGFRDYARLFGYGRNYQA